MGQTTPKSSHSPWATWIPFLTSMPGCTPLTTPNDSSICSRTSTQLCNKGPTGYNGTSHFHPQNCSFLFDDNHPHLIHPTLNRPHSPTQMASGSSQPFCHNILYKPTDRPTVQPTDRQTDRWSKRMFRTVSAYAKEWCTKNYTLHLKEARHQSEINDR